MAWCTGCGAADQFDRFCVSCGAPMAVAEPTVGAIPPAQTVQDMDPADTMMRAEPTVNLRKDPSAPSVGFAQSLPLVGSAQGSSFPPPPPPPVLYPLGYAPPPAPPGRRRGWLIAGLAFVVVAALATTAVLVLQRTGGTAAGVAVLGTSAVRSAAPPPSARPSRAGESNANPTSGGTRAGGTTASSPAAPSVATSIPLADPMGGPKVDIPCGPGYIVQVASELDPVAFARRVAEIRAAGTIPVASKWADAGSSCSLFTSQTNVLVLYAGPFASPYDACPARLASPPDAFIKGTTPETSTQYVSCLCPAVVTQLPAITTAGQQGVWVGELQRVLGSKLDYSVGAINANPAAGDLGRWGTYTAETAAAVGRFQRDNSIPITGQVDSTTWSTLQRSSC